MRYLFWFAIFVLLVVPSNAQNEYALGYGDVVYSDEIKVGQIYSWEYSIQNDSFIYVNDGDTIDIQVLDTNTPVRFEYQSNRSPAFFVNGSDFDNNFSTKSSYEKGFGYVKTAKMLYPLFYTFDNGTQISMLERLSIYHNDDMITQQDKLLFINGGGRYETIWEFNMTNGVLLYFRMFDVVDEKLLEINFKGMIFDQISKEESDINSLGLVSKENMLLIGIIPILIIRFTRFQKVVINTLKK